MEPNDNNERHIEDDNSSILFFQRACTITNLYGYCYLVYKIQYISTFVDTKHIGSVTLFTNPEGETNGQEHASKRGGP